MRGPFIALAISMVLLAAACSGGPAPEVLYGECGHDLLPDGACQAGECAEDGDSARIFAIWKAQFLAVHGIDEAHFESAVQVKWIELMDRGEWMSWRVEYVFIADWARTHQVESAELDLDIGSLSDADIEAAIDLALEPAERFDITDVVPYATAQAAASQCGRDLGGSAEADACDIDFINQTGELVMRGQGTIDEDDNRCIDLKVDLQTGELYSCEEDPCYVF
jgi:hypothetical protein